MSQSQASSINDTCHIRQKWETDDKRKQVSLGAWCCANLSSSASTRKPVIVARRNRQTQRANRTQIKERLGNAKHPSSSRHWVYSAKKLSGCVPDRQWACRTAPFTFLPRLQVFAKSHLYWDEWFVSTIILVWYHFNGDVCAIGRTASPHLNFWLSNQSAHHYPFVSWATGVKHSGRHGNPTVVFTIVLKIRHTFESVTTKT